MSLVGAPSVIFLDEPTTSLDPEVRLGVWQTVKEIAGSGVMILLTTQYLDSGEARGRFSCFLLSSEVYFK
jgi:ABC-2 type transport system ATP-binding protein